MVKYFLIILFIYVNLTGISFIKLKKVSDYTSIIIWSKDRKLTWDDYWCKPPITSDYRAVSNVNRKIKFYKHKDTLYFISVACLLKNGSWVYNNSRTARLLKHEQTHFDIVELYCRKLRELLSKSSLTKKNYEQIINVSSKDIYKQYKKYDSLYDKESDYSKHIIKQDKWSEKVDEELRNLEQYQDTLVIKIFKN